jgi:hypothetical protein
MIEWSEQQQQIRQMFRRFVESEIAPKREELEFGDLAPYDVLRKMVQTFGIGELAKGQFYAQLEKDERRLDEDSLDPGDDGDQRASGGLEGEMAAMRIIPIIELSRYSPGLITAMGVSAGLTAGAIVRRGTLAQ